MAARVWQLGAGSKECRSGPSAAASGRGPHCAAAADSGRQGRRTASAQTGPWRLHPRWPCNCWRDVGQPCGSADWACGRARRRGAAADRPCGAIHHRSTAAAGQEAAARAGTWQGAQRGPSPPWDACSCWGGSRLRQSGRRGHRPAVCSRRRGARQSRQRRRHQAFRIIPINLPFSGGEGSRSQAQAPKSHCACNWQPGCQPVCWQAGCVACASAPVPVLAILTAMFLAYGRFWNDSHQRACPAGASCAERNATEI